ncbi:DUF3703 domain-containing protein [Pedobacter cryotolerans]|uniref:DUF3703 domain-containing protein n=2 Tax=Pedobacter cryotolerans TaxID=2571270 RepID=A0A4U1BYE9_9SPHI|nr:DUF3703 domain-containing protein [Pedobacter cryotolerans]
MSMNTFIPTSLKKFYQIEIDAYQLSFKLGNLQKAWRHLERAHVIGQAYPIEHSYAHWKMLLFGIKIKSYREIIGQIPRLLVGGVKSFVGKVPVGNTGGSNVPPLKSLPIGDDLLAIFKQAGLQSPR